MWTDEDFTRSGGFDVSGYSDSSPAAAPETKTSKRPSSIFPLNIKQIVEAKEDVMQVNGLPVTMMRIVAIVKSIEISSTKMIFQLQDWSGEILGMLWLESTSDEKPAGVIENTYVQVSGTKRNQNGKNVLFIYNIVPVTDLSQITHHYLQVIHIQLKSEERKQTASVGFGEGDMSNTTVHSGMTPQQSKVYNVIKQAKSEAGMNKSEILTLVKMLEADVDKAVEFLITEGHVYCTIDDDHFRVTDG